MLLLSAGCGKVLEVLTTSNGTLHNPLFNFGDWSLGIILIFLKSSLLATSSFSSLGKSLNFFGSSQSSSYKLLDKECDFFSFFPHAMRLNTTHC